eukprot:TRINITY_DN3874_c0_g1_i1.p1 TRINITY_DN3874_c0_g1~~TRINITY_DN3874_c0_g1_i1.p1  ORF type:complete len:198 (+),score=6.84 TRINITY_DN3874_c0_g1_i1:295-888(+)
MLKWLISLLLFSICAIADDDCGNTGESGDSGWFIRYLNETESVDLNKGFLFGNATDFGTICVGETTAFGSFTFERKKDLTYDYSCTVQDPSAIEAMFASPVILSGASNNIWTGNYECACRTEVPAAGQYVAGFKLTQRGIYKRIGLEFTYRVQACEIETKFSDTPLKPGDTFEQIVVISRTSTLVIPLLTVLVLFFL